ncbi:MAG TPA: ATP-binding protein, partial [Tepidisphaeraceae bacterium]|nr:ATP-binding protein [Tepidisphaeraceae bacterium]
AGSIFLIRVSCQRLIKTARAAAPFVDASATQAPDTGFAFLTRALTEVLEAAARSAGQANLRAREMEIRLKIAMAEREHAQAIIHSISDAVLVTDPFDDLVLANESAARTFDFNLADAPRRPLEQVLHDPKMIALIREVRLGHGQGTRRIVEHEVRAGETSRLFKVTLSSVSGAAAPAGVIAVLHDVTREREVSEMKNDFVSMVSHELRTPLASIHAYVEMLIDREADDEKTRGEFYEVIQNEANRLSRLIDNILNISRIESGLVRVNKQPLSLTVVLKDAMEVIAPQARQKQISISEDLTPVLYQTMADRDMLYQAALNLLSNAVKYTQPGGSIAVSVAPDNDGKKILVRICDTGVGIPPKDLPFVFDKFFRAESNSRMATGSGLGLSLVKHIVEIVHQGRMLVESQLGKGSCFGFELELCE